MNKKTIVINGKDVEATSFGVNNYSNGMELVTVSIDVLTTNVLETEGIFLNPTTKPSRTEIFCVLGTKAQYKGFRSQQLTAHYTREAIHMFSMDDSTRVNQYAEDMSATHVDWWHLETNTTVQVLLDLISEELPGHVQFLVEDTLTAIQQAARMEADKRALNIAQYFARHGGTSPVTDILGMYDLRYLMTE